MPKKYLTCVICQRVFDRSEYDVGYKYCSLTCKYWSGVPDKDDKGCWPWRFKIHRRGYGLLRWKSFEYVAHKMGYACHLKLDDYPENRMVFNMCGNLNCVKGEHWTEDTRWKHIGRKLRKEWNN